MVSLMSRFKRLTGAITPVQMRLAVVFALAAACFLYLAVMVSTKAANVSERVRSNTPTAYDVIDNGGLGAASWTCANVPITIPCGGSSESTPRE